MIAQTPALVNPKGRWGRGGFLCASCSTQDAAATRITASSVRRLRRLYLGVFADNLFV
jgi:hypothetical protein